MATCVPSVASTEETTNYARLCRLLIEVGSQALRDKFDQIHPPASLYRVLTNCQSKLQSLRSRGILDPIQWGILYPAIPSSVSSAHFDITILCVLLRNICGLPYPSADWKTSPATSDKSLKADILRLKQYRNTVYAHAVEASVNDATFNSYWVDIEDVLVRLGGSSYAVAVTKLKTVCMDPAVEEHYKELLYKWKKNEENIQDELVKIHNKVNKVQKDVCDISDKLDAIGYLLIEMKLDGVTFRNTGTEDHVQQENKKQQVMCEMCQKVFETLANGSPSEQRPHRFLSYLQSDLGAEFKDATEGSLRITVQCHTVEVLERLWEDFSSGHLNAVAEECLLTDDIKRRLEVVSIQLKTTILEEDYLACKSSLVSQRNQDSPKEEEELLPRDHTQSASITQTHTAEETEATMTGNLAVNCRRNLTNAPGENPLQLEEEMQNSGEPSQAEAANIPVNEFQHARHLIKVIHVSSPSEQREGKLKIAVQFRNPESLESFWEDYRSGHLNAVAEKYLLTDDIRKRFDVESVKLDTTILEEDYRTCKEFLLQKADSSLERHDSKLHNSDNIELPINDPTDYSLSSCYLTEEGGLPFSSGSKLSTILPRKPKFLDQLALCLDREMRLIPNWKHFAREMRVDEDVIKRLEQYSEHSPTIRLFEYLEIMQPQLTIQQLKQALLQIRRNDLFSLLTTKAGCDESEMVQEVITSRDIKSTSLRAELLDELALALDGTSLVLANWYNLAIKLGAPRKTCWEIERRSVHDPTKQMFEYFTTARPQMTLKRLKEALQFIARKDLLNFLLKLNLGDEVLIKDVITPGSEVLETMAAALNREDAPAVKNWSHLASKLEVPLHVRRELAGETTGPKGKSPTKEVMQWLVARFPGIDLVDVVKALDRIQRNDAIEIITKQFPDTVDSSLKRSDAFFQGGFSVDLAFFDPTGETLTSRYNREESVPLPMQENVKKPSHCGTLPDRTYLVGRDGTCEQIIGLLTSNKAAEILAPPGYGKTSVVIEVGHRMEERGKFVAYVTPRGVTCVEDLGGKIIEAFGAIPGEDPIRETLRRIRAFEPKSVVLIIENIDNLLHLEDQLNQEEHDQKSDLYCAKMRGKFKKPDFLSFLTDIGQCRSIHLLLTSRENFDFSVCFPSELIELQPLEDKDSATLFTKCDSSLDDNLVKELVRVCGGIPLIICTMLAILKRESPQNFTQRLSVCSPASLIKALNPDFIANEERIDKCLEVCLNRLSQESQDVLVMMSTFPHRFTQEQFLAVQFKSPAGLHLEKYMNSLKHSSLVCFDRQSYHFSLRPFIRDFFSLKPQHKEAKSIFIRHYSDLTVKLWKQFLSQNSKAAIERYRNEKGNIREAMAWCGDHHPELDQETREHCIYSFNKSAVFLATMMRKQEFELLFCKLSQHCRYDMHLYSACMTHIGMKIVLSCTCTPHICRIALYRAKSFLSHANDIQSIFLAPDDSTRAQCLSKLGFCLIREGYYDRGYEYLNQALTLRKKRNAHSTDNKDKVMLAACYNDLAASQMLQKKHMTAIETRRNYVLGDYQLILGDHPFVATTLNWIGFSYQALGDYDNAIKFTSLALEIREQLLGDHQETARSLYDLGVAFSSKKEYESALQFLQKAAALQKEVLDTHEELIFTHQAMSVVFQGLGRKEEAERELELAGECVKMLDSPVVPLEIVETLEHNFFFFKK